MRRTSVVAGIAAALLATGCGATKVRHLELQAPSQSIAVRFTACMRAHGVPQFPEPVDGRVQLTPSSGIDPSSPAFSRASRECASLAPHGPTRTGATARGATGSRIDAFLRWLRGRAAAGQFSGVVLVARPGAGVTQAGYGFADRATRAPITPRTRFCVASIGKLFTAVAIAQLVQAHRLAFDERIGHVVPGLPPRIGDRVTIGELLDMTSGLGDAVLSRSRPPRTLAGMVSLIARERPVGRPGTRFGYSNDGYILLGAALARVTGESWTAAVRRGVLVPAGMRNTDLDPYVPARVPGMAHGYAPADVSGAVQLANPSGGASSTVGDLLRFARALLAHRLLDRAMTAAVLTPRVDAPQPGGPRIDRYTYGFAEAAIDGVTFVGHNGGTPGYEGELDIYPRRGDVAVVLCNADGEMVPAIQASEAILTAGG